ncbi:MAG: pilin [Patescibacteria group bacterium]|jgi:hypothetical protein
MRIVKLFKNFGKGILACLAILAFFAVGVNQARATNFSPAQQSFLCPVQQDNCPTGAYKAAPLSPDEPGFNIAMLKQGCQTNEKNVGCLKYFGTPDSITVCCLPLSGGKPDCSAYGVGASCKTGCDAATEEEKNGNCPNTGEKCCKPKAIATPGGSSSCYIVMYNGSEANPAVVPGKEKFTVSCVPQSDVALGKCDNDSPPKCSDGVNFCCAVKPDWKPATTAAPTAVKPPSEYKLSNPLGTVSIPVILGRIIKTFLGIVGGIALMVFVYGGLMWMTARGDQAQVKKGQDALKAASIGLFIVMFSYTLAGNLVSFLTSEQQTIASEEGRTSAEAPTEVGNQAATVSSQLKAAEESQQAGQAGAAQAGAEAGVPPQTSGCGQLKGKEYVDCINASGQALYTTPSPQLNLPGGQKDCKYAKDPSKCSTVGWKTICNEKVFDTGYGTYNNANCATQADCAGKKGIVLKTSSFGNQCGAGNVCCKMP